MQYPNALMMNNPYDMNAMRYNLPMPQEIPYMDASNVYPPHLMQQAKGPSEPSSARSGKSEPTIVEHPYEEAYFRHEQRMYAWAQQVPTMADPTTEATESPAVVSREPTRPSSRGSSVIESADQPYAYDLYPNQAMLAAQSAQAAAAFNYQLQNLSVYSRPPNNGFQPDYNVPNAPSMNYNMAYYRLLQQQAIQQQQQQQQAIQQQQQQYMMPYPPPMPMQMRMYDPIQRPARQGELFDPSASKKQTRVNSEPPKRQPPPNKLSGRKNAKSMDHPESTPTILTKPKQGLLYDYSSQPSYEGVKPTSNPPKPEHILQVIPTNPTDSLDDLSLPHASIRRMQNGRTVLAVFTTSHHAQTTLDTLSHPRIALRKWTPVVKRNET
jgi:hypothetical protein